MYRFFHWVIICLLVFSSCSKEETAKESAGFSDSSEYSNKIPGLFRMNEPEEPGSLFPPSIKDVIAAQIASQVYEGLFRLDPETLKPIPCLAKSWEFSENRTVLRLRLKEGVYFQDDLCFPNGKGRRLTAEDVVQCFENLCSPNKNNSSFSVVEGVLRGAKDYYTAQQEGHYEVDFQGVVKTAENELTFYFEDGAQEHLYFLSRPEAFIYPVEAVNKYGFGMDKQMVGTGPFQFSSWDEERLLLSKNPTYHLKDSLGKPLPRLEGLSISFVKDKKMVLSNFQQGKLDRIYSLPNNFLSDILEDAYSKGGEGFSHYDLQRAPELSTEILGFNLQSDIFSNEDFRKAIAFAIDRKALVDKALNGQAFEAGTGGIVPPGFPEYDYGNIQGYGFYPDSARIYFEASGLTAEELPRLTLHIASKGENNILVGSMIRQQIQKSLGIEVGIQILSFPELVSGVAEGKIDFYRIGWAAEFPSITEFLTIFSSSSVPSSPNEMSFPNVGRYRNAEFDQWLNIGTKSIVDSVRMEGFQMAEQILMKECPVVVLWYDEGFQLLQPYVRNLKINAVNYLDFREVYFERPEDLNT